MLTLLLVRHATHDLVGVALAGRMPGVSLSAAGRAQAEALADTLARRPVSAVVSSPLDRARETAAPIAARHGLSVEVDEGLNEIDCGDWTGKRFDELPGDPRWADWNRHRESASTPGGETMRAVRSRAMDAVRRHGAASGRHGAASGRHGTADPTVAVVSHSDVIKAVVCGVLGLSLDRHDAFAVDPASITTLHIWGETMRVARLNEAVGG